MDGAGSPPPDAFRPSSADTTADDSAQLPASSSSGSVSAHPSSPTTSPVPHQAPHSSHQLTGKEQLGLLTPKNMLRSVTSQLLGETSPEQQKADQEREAKVAQQIARSQQEFQQYQLQRKQERQQIADQAIELKAEGLKKGEYTGSSAMHSQTTPGGDRSEIPLLIMAAQNAEQAKVREQKARQAMSAQSTPKGPQAEGGKPKTNMMAQMLSGNDSSKNELKNDKDARQRQREQAMGE